MAHEIDKSNNRNNMAFVGETPWHGLGQQLSEEASIDVWKQEAGMEWEAIATPVRYGVPTDTGEELLTFDGRVVIRRSDTRAPLSIVSNRYKIFQPGQVLEFFRDLTEQYGFKMETAGCLLGGTKVWGLAKVDDNIDLGGDVVKRYLLVATSYDASTPTIVKQTSVRVVCNNTLEVGLTSHTGKAFDSIAHNTFVDTDAIKTKMVLDDNWSVFRDTLVKLAEKKMSDSAAEMYFADIFFDKMEETERAGSKAVQRRVDEMMSYFHRAPGNDLPSAQNTAWGAVNAMTYYTDHQAKSKSDDARLNKAWFGDNLVLKTKAFNRALQFAGI